MKYTFTDLEGKEATVDIPVEYLSEHKELGSMGACKQYLYENGYIKEPVKNGNRSTKHKHKRKPDYRKRTVITGVKEYLEEFIPTLPDAENVSVAVTNVERTIQFTVADDTYELTLSRKRKTK